MSGQYNEELNSQLVMDIRISKGVQIIKEHKQITIPMIQRYLWLSYSDSVKVIQELEKRGILDKQTNIMLPRKVNRNIINQYF